MLLALYSLWVPLPVVVPAVSAIGKRTLGPLPLSTTGQIGKRTLPPVPISH